MDRALEDDMRRLKGGTAARERTALKKTGFPGARRRPSSAPKKKKAGRPEEFTAPQLADALKRARGMIEAASRLAGCSAETLRAYMAKYPELRQLQVAEKELLKDTAELKLHELVGRGSLGAICFFLKTQARERGYIERQEHAGPAGGPIPHHLDLSRLSDAELEVLQRLMQKATQGAVEAPLVADDDRERHRREQRGEGASATP